MLRSSGTLTLQPPGRFSELCNMLKATVQRKTACQSPDEEDEDQAENNAMSLQRTLVRPFLPWQLRLGKTLLPLLCWVLAIIALQDETGLHNGREVLCSGESIKGLGAVSDQFVSHLFPILLSAVWEADSGA